MTDGDYISMGMRPGGRVMLRVHILHWIAKALRIQFNIGGQPYGASYQRAINHGPRRDGAVYAAGESVRRGD